AEPRLHRRRVGQVDAGAAGHVLLEDQLLLDLQAAIAAEGAGDRVAVHRKASCNPADSARISSSLVSSVTATSSRSASSGRSGSVMWMVKASAQRPELVQMLLVAFSRRMCCSRVESVSTQPRRPSLSTVCPISRPGIWRMYFSRVANSPT